MQLTSDDVLERIETRILGGEFQPGDMIPSERALVGELGVSRPVVREALRRLQERGLIASQPGRGNFVQAVRPTSGSTSVDQLVKRGTVTLRELVTARAMLETEAAGLAAIHRTEHDLKHMDSLLTALSISEDIGASAELDLAFHEAIAVASGNKVVQIMFGSIRPFVEAMVFRSLTDRLTRAAGLPVHHDVLRAIAARDERGARNAMRLHVSSAIERYGADIDRPVSSVVLSRRPHAPEVAHLLSAVGESLASDTQLAG